MKMTLLMRHAGKLILLFLGIVCSLGCHSDTSGGPAGTSASAGSEIPPFRKEVKKQPVASYREKTDNPLNDWYFSVSLYETPKTFQYLIKMQFEEVRGDDTLELPD